MRATDQSARHGGPGRERASSPRTGGAAGASRFIRRAAGLGILSLLACGGALPACSALGLADLPQADCVRGSGGMTGDAFCASLSLTSPPADTCHTWQCNEQSRHCEQLARDDDEDGAPTMMCAGSATPDCDDASATNHPGGTETCDGLDQNCDGVPDDGAILASEMPSSLTTLSAGAMQFAFAYQADSEEAYLLTRNAAVYRGVTIATSATPVDLMFTQVGSGMIVPQGSIRADGAVAALGSQRYAVAARTFVAASGCQQWSIFPVRSGANAVAIRSTPADAYQLPACPGGGGAQLVTALAIAGHPTPATTTSDTVLAAWLDGADDARACGAAPARAVSVGGAVLNDRTSVASRVSADVVALGQSVGDGPPTVLALDDAFLVAYPRADMTVAVHLVSVTVDGTGTAHVTASATPEFVEPAGTMVRQGVTLARGPTASGATTIALAYYEGCAGSNPITVRMLTRSGATITGSGTPAGDLGQGPARSLLRLAYQPRAAEWILGWRSASGVFAQRLFEDGAAEGGAFAVATSSTVSAFVIEPMTTSEPLYRAIVVDGTNLDQITFGCAPPTP